jgi:2-polyprenyl-3-methyl-5-hydroxy-6-metoxy-1,4-benzoquinol methylase
MPVAEDMDIAYRSYYTHENPDRKRSRTMKKISGFRNQILKLFLRLTPIYQERENFNRMYLGNIKPGRLLGVGCGSGTRLAYLADLGWSVEGQEVDPISAAAAEKYGIKVYLGPLDDLNLTAASYDAIVMHHVIEHVNNPLNLLMECRRLLAPGGTIISITPNGSSSGHKIFKAQWRGLEPPRHLFIYNQQSLRRLSQLAGFNIFQTWTTSANAHHFFLGSLNVMLNGKKINLPTKALLNMASKFFLITARILYAFNQDSGDECVLKLRQNK